MNAILHQLLVAIPTLAKYAVAEKKHKGGLFTAEYSTLWGILEKCIIDPACGNVVCFLDALDECEGSSLRLLTRSLVDLFSHQQQAGTCCGLKVLATSRPYFSIENQFVRLQRIRLRGEDCTDETQSDIELVIQRDLDELRISSGLPDSVLVELKTRIINGADKTFLWASLVLRILKETAESSKAELQRILEDIPEDLKAVYEKILRRIRRPDKAVRILQAVLIASEPLSLDELNVVMSIESEHHSFEHLVPHMSHSAKRTIKDQCGYFVKVIDKKVLFIHQTAREFLLHLPDDASIHFEWGYKLRIKECHLLLAATCIWYLLLAEIKDKNGAKDDRDPETNDHAFDLYCFHNHAAVHWATHFREAEHLVKNELFRSSFTLCNTQSEAFYTWFDIFWNYTRGYDGPRRYNELHIRSFFGHVKAVELLLDQGADINSPNGINKTALHLAASEGHLITVQFLLGRGASINATDNKGQTPLHSALLRFRKRSTIDTEQTAAFLIHAGADINAQSNGIWNTPLHLAVRFSFYRTLEQLLDSGARIDIFDSKGSTALSIAAEMGNIKAAQLLLSRGANVNACHDTTPLCAAVESGHRDMVRFLVKEGALVNLETLEGNTALTQAISWDNASTVRTLLELGADIRGNPEVSPLYEASQLPDSEIALLLLSYGANANPCVRNVGRTPISGAITRRKRRLVRILLEKGADVNAKDLENGYTMMHQAAADDDDWITLQLLKLGARIDIQDGRGRTPLEIAQKFRSKRVRKLLRAALLSETTLQASSRKVHH